MNFIVSDVVAFPHVGFRLFVEGFTENKSDAGALVIYKNHTLKWKFSITGYRYGRSPIN